MVAVLLLREPSGHGITARSLPELSDFSCWNISGFEIKIEFSFFLPLDKSGFLRIIFNM